MKIIKNKCLQLALSSVFAGMFALCTVQVQAAEAELNVCAGTDEMPFSNAKQEGFENDLARLVAKALGRTANFVFWKDARLMVRDYLDKDKCDLIMAVDTTDPRVLKTNSYYKSGYVFITREDSGIDISSWNDDLLKQHNFRIGVLPDSPGKVMLLQINRFEDMFDYFAEKQHFKSTRNKYIRVDPAGVVEDVAAGSIHAAMLWAPEAARYVKHNSVPLKMQLVKDDAKKNNGESVPMHYEVAMGVRKGDTALQQELNRVIAEHRSEIEAILRNEGIPLLPLSNQ